MTMINPNGGQARTPTLVPPDKPTGGRAREVLGASARRSLLFELLIVLAIFPLPATISALVSAANHLIQGGAQASHASNLVPGSLGLSVFFGVILELSSLAAAALVWYLLARSGEGTTSIGLDRRHPKLDAAYVLPVFLGVFLASNLIGGLLQEALNLKTFPVNDPVNGLAFLPVLLASGLVAGIVEETVVLGFLVRRLEQLGVRTVPLVMICVAVRVSYHLYYGPGAIPVVLWGTASVIVYRKIRRLTPFIIVHSLWDMSLFLAEVLGRWVLVGEFLALMPLSIVFCALWWPRKPRPDLPWTEGPPFASAAPWALGAPFAGAAPGPPPAPGGDPHVTPSHGPISPDT